MAGKTTKTTKTAQALSKALADLKTAELRIQYLLRSREDVLNQANDARAQAALERQRAAHLSRQLADQRDRAVPRQVRTVTRTITYTGDPVWLAQTLAQSLPEGCTTVPNGSRITVEQTADRTVSVQGLGREDRARA